MRQAVIVGPDRFEVVRAAVPRLQTDEEILVRTVASGICSGDLMPWYLEKKIGSVLGHEVVGRAVEVGRGVKQDIHPGDLVFMHHHAPCLSADCPDCTRGAFVHCAVWRSSRLDPGGMADFIRVPRENIQGDTFPAATLTPEQAVFIEPLACSIKAVQRVPGLGRRLSLQAAQGMIVGCGVMGLLTLAAARAVGVKHLTAVEPDPDRRRLALEFGAVKALAPQEARQTLSHAVDFVIIGPGESEVIKEALAYVRPGGTAILFTPTPSGIMTELDLNELYFREVSLVPSYSCGTEETRQAYEMLRKKRVRPESLVTHRFDLDNIQEAYDTARRGGPILKVLITFPDGTS
jgi:L-iditol 2-dehydrogenase